MGQCHYSQAVDPTPGVTVGGERPASPIGDTMADGAMQIVNGTMGLATVIGAGVTGIRNTLISPSTGSHALEDVLADSSLSYRSSTTWENNGSIDVGFDYFNRIADPGSIAPMPKGFTATITTSEGTGTMSFRPVSTSKPYVPTLQIDNLPGWFELIKIKFLGGG
jgi:hypothetical protein